VTVTFRVYWFYNHITVYFSYIDIEVKTDWGINGEIKGENEKNEKRKKQVTVRTTLMTKGINRVADKNNERGKKDIDDSSLSMVLYQTSK